MAFQDVYQIVDIASFLGEQAVNVYFYEQNNVLSPSDTAAELGDRFIAEVMPSIRAAQSTNVVHQQMNVTNLFDPSDQSIRFHSLAGTKGTTETTSLFEALGMVLNHDNGALRPGSKRYPGLDEVDISNGVLTNAGTLALFNTLAGVLNNTLTDGVLAAWLPVVVGRILDSGAYRLPANSGEAVVGAILSAVVNTLITTQNSRKIGRGA